MFVTMCLASMVTMHSVNSHPEVISNKCPCNKSTTAATPPINSTTSASMNVTTTRMTIKTTMTTTASTTSRCYIDVRSTTTLAEPTNLAMLFLSQEMYSLIEPEGVLSTTLDFNGHDLLDSCGLIFRNQYFIYGGVPQYEVQTNRRILQLQDCGLIKIHSDLSFDHRAGTCG